MYLGINTHFIMRFDFEQGLKFSQELGLKGMEVAAGGQAAGLGHAGDRAADMAFPGLRRFVIGGAGEEDLDRAIGAAALGGGHAAHLFGEQEGVGGPAHAGDAGQAQVAFTGELGIGHGGRMRLWPADATPLPPGFCGQRPPMQQPTGISQEAQRHRGPRRLIPVSRLQRSSVSPCLL